MGHYLGVPDKNIYSEGYTNKTFRKKKGQLNLSHILEAREQIELNYYELELLKSLFDSESNNKTLECMNIFQKLE